MMNTLKQKLATNWHAGRILRLVMGLFLAAAALVQHDGMLGLFGAFFLFQAITDTGCCGAGSCYAPPRKATDKKENGADDIQYEEIK